MNRALRRSGLVAAAGLVLALAAGCSSAGTTSSSPASSASSPAGAHGTLTVFGAGTLSTPFTAELQAFKKQNPGVTIHSQFGASGDMVKDITQLGQRYYYDPGLAAAVLKNSPDSSVAETETSLLAALQSGQIDYLAIYRSNALEEHLKYIALPAQVNLSDSSMAAAYGKITIHAGSLGALTAKPIIYGLTIPSTAPDAALGQKFVSFVLSPQGRTIMSSNGFVVISPALASSQAKVPAPLRSL